MMLKKEKLKMNRKGQLTETERWKDVSGGSCEMVSVWRPAADWRRGGGGVRWVCPLPRPPPWPASPHAHGRYSC
jgi:hypothetical protein